MEEEQMLTKEQILDMLDAGQYKELKEELGNMYPVDIAETLEDFEQKPLVMVFRLLAKEEAAETFTYMNSDMREVLIGALTDSELEEVMEEMYLDDTVDVLEEMPANVVDRLLMVTDEETRAQINQLLQYPEDSAGSIMNVEYIALRKEMTVEESILKIRQVGLNRETIYTCYVTEKRKLIGRVDVKELLTTGESRTIEEIMDTNVLYAHTTDDQEDVAMMINKYGLIALPIVDHEMCMVGIVTVDDAMLVMQEESYTSKASFWDKDVIPAYKSDDAEEYHFSGKRIHRGQYRTASGQVLNADVNGALNIMRKSRVVDVNILYSRGEVDTPIRIRIA